MYRNRSLFYLIFCALLLLATGCDYQLDEDNSILVDTSDKYFYSRIVEDLISNEIEYEIVEETAIRVRKADAQYVMYRLNKLHSEVLPGHRSTALTQPSRWRFIKLLDEHGIKYETVDLYGQRYITWQEEDSDKVEELWYRAILGD